MARSAYFDGHNRLLNHPGTEPCPAFFADDNWVSCWILSDEEMAEIAKTGRVWLAINTPEATPPVPTHISGHALIEPVTPIKKLILP